MPSQTASAAIRRAHGASPGQPPYIAEASLRLISERSMSLRALSVFAGHLQPTYLISGAEARGLALQRHPSCIPSPAVFVSVL